MARGGKRAGAGRPAGSATKRTREIADQAAANGVMPLEVMLHAMRWHFEAKRYDEAHVAARDAAPYLHPKLAAIEHSSDPERPVKVVYEWLPIEEAK